MNGPPRGPTSSPGPARPSLVRGPPVRLLEFAAMTVPNRRFAAFDLAAWDRFFLPPTMASLVDQAPLAEHQFVEDDNRSAIDRRRPRRSTGSRSTSP